ncbi:MAG: hypothetical protein J6T84_11895 [Spirochaetaceae bacterium]|nr:hypothetical protein [Spirochaetaceae bacterium]
MSTGTKTISALEQKRKEAAELIDKIETDIGQQLLTAKSQNVDQSLSARFTELAGNRQKLLRTVSDIEKKLAQIKDADVFVNEKQDEALRLEKDLKEQFLILGNLMYKNYNSSFPAVFDTFYADAKKEFELADLSAQRVESLKFEMETASFVAKLRLRTKYISEKRLLDTHSSKADRILAKGAETAMSNGKPDFGSAETLTELDEQAQTCAEFLSDIAEKKEAVRKKCGERSGLIDELKKDGVLDLTGKKRISELKKQILELEKEQRKLSLEAGHSFVNLYCTKDGVDIIECNGIAGDSVELVKKERMRLLSLNRRISILQMEDAVVRADSKIEDMKKNVVSMKNRIADLQNQIEELEKNIDAAENARNVVIGKKAALENEEAAFIKLIDKDKSVKK